MHTRNTPPVPHASRQLSRPLASLTAFPVPSLRSLTRAWHSPFPSPHGRTQVPRPLSRLDTAPHVAPQLRGGSALHDTRFIGVGSHDLLLSPPGPTCSHSVTLVDPFSGVRAAAEPSSTRGDASAGGARPKVVCLLPPATARRQEVCAVTADTARARGLSCRRARVLRRACSRALSR